MTEESVSLLCKGCGEVFEAFLSQMADHNAKVVCPKCGTSNDCTQSPGAKSQTAVD